MKPMLNMIRILVICSLAFSLWLTPAFANEAMIEIDQSGAATTHLVNAQGEALVAHFVKVEKTSDGALIEVFASAPSVSERPGVVATFGLAGGYGIPMGVSVGVILTPAKLNCFGGGKGDWMPGEISTCEARGMIFQVQGSTLGGQIELGYASSIGLGIPWAPPASQDGIMLPISLGYAIKAVVASHWASLPDLGIFPGNTYAGAQLDLSCFGGLTLGLMAKINGGGDGPALMPVLGFRVGL